MNKFQITLVFTLMLTTLIKAQILPDYVPKKDRLTAGQQLCIDCSLTSKNGSFILIYQNDGNLVLFKKGVGVKWATNIPNTTKCIFQSDGNFVLYANNVAVWASGTNGLGSYLILQDDGNLVIYSKDNIGVWASNTIEKVEENKVKEDFKKTSQSNKIINQDNPSLPILKVSEKNADNQLPKTILVFDKAQSLNLGNTVSITKVEKIKVPGEKKPQIVPTILGNGRVIEKVNNIYTIKLNANTAQKLKDYTDGDENYFCMKAEDKTVVASKPRIMVIPKIIKQELFKDGDYQLNSFEKMIISSFKNKLEDNDYTTIGFESILKKVYEDRLINEGTKVDLKTMILEASGSDFYVEFEPLESGDCNKTLDFKIRNYANGEDVASDIKILNTCGTPDEYKNFASAILNQGALNKINSQYASLVSQGRKVSANFTIKNGSSAEFGKEYKGIRLEEHIENCIQQYAFNGNYKPAGTVNNRMSFSEVSIPLLKEETGQNYSPNAFSLDILKYLKEQAGIECEKSVVGSNINITIK